MTTSITTLQYRISGGDSGSVQLDPSVSTGLALKNAILQASYPTQSSFIPLDAIRVLVSGKFLKDEQTLEQQGVKTTSKLMVMLKSDVIPSSSASPSSTTTSSSSSTIPSFGSASTSSEIQQTTSEIDEQIAEARKIESWAATAAEMASRESSASNSRYQQYYFELRDQTGREIPIPVNERRALIFGMTLQEKARTLLNNNKTALALELLLKADKDGFCKVGFQLLDMVDNYGLLCLDIAWAYFKLKDPTFVRDADARLINARRCLEKSYGRDLERLIALKGPECPERIHFLRLELMEGILAFYQGKQNEAKMHVAEAARQLQLYKVTDEDLVPMLSMGFGERESRLALRACGKDMNRASVYVLQKREEDVQRREEERRSRRAERERQSYGKTASGDDVNINLLNSLSTLGFDKSMIVEALKQTNNSEQESLNLLLNQPELLRVAKKPRTEKTTQTPVDEVQLASLVSMGYTTQKATAALRNAESVEAAISLLASGEIPMDEEEQEEKDGKEGAGEEAAGEKEESEPTDEERVKKAEEQRKAEEEQRRAEEERRKKENEVAEFLEDIDTDDKSALDLPLEEEENAIAEYSKMLDLI